MENPTTHTALSDKKSFVVLQNEHQRCKQSPSNFIQIRKSSNTSYKAIATMAERTARKVLLPMKLEAAEMIASDSKFSLMFSSFSPSSSMSSSFCSSTPELLLLASLSQHFGLYQLSTRNAAVLLSTPFFSASFTSQ